MYPVYVSQDHPLFSARKDDAQKSVSNFITIPSFVNFSAMTGGITGAWSGLKLLSNKFDNPVVPFLICIAFGIGSLFLSTDAMKKDGKWNIGLIFIMTFIAFINSMVLFGAVMAASSALPNMTDNGANN